MSLLEVKNLTLTFDQNSSKILKEVSFSLFPGEIVALVGESGSGKSLTASAIMRLFSLKFATGSIQFEGTNLLELSEKEMREIRGKKIAMIFQDPMTSLNPTLKIGSQIMEGLQIPHHEKRKKIIEILLSVGISEPKRRIDQYPHQLSGGMRQRVMIAIAMALSPKLLIADEPTTALDVTIQAQILDLMLSLQQRKKMTILLITHDLRVAASIADRILVMHDGRIVESGPIETIFEKPNHPYTKTLLNHLMLDSKATNSFDESGSTYEKNLRSF